MIVCEKLTKRYERTPALLNMDLQIGEGKIVGLLGANGSGKTTLIKLIAGLLKPTGGTVAIDGNRPGINSVKNISYLPEHSFLDLNMKVREAVRYYTDFFSDFDSDLAYRLLKELDVDPGVKIKKLSKGNREKAALALVISRRVGIYILDEPIGGVDPVARDRILDTILRNFHPGATVILSTHIITDIERILDDVIFLNKGQVILHEDADRLREEKGMSIDQIYREVFA